MTARNTSALVDELSRKADALQHWLAEQAFPLWWSAGADQSAGGFEELLNLNGQPVVVDRRFRVQPRQVYSYVTAGTMGWSGPWAEAALHGAGYFESRYMLESGYFASAVGTDGLVTNPEFDLYNQAFALFAYAHLALAFPERAGEYEDKATELLAVLKRGFRHAKAGFEEGDPQKLPLCSNTHLHLLEATLAWESATRSGNPDWADL